MMKNSKWAASPYALWTMIFVIAPLLLVVYFAFTSYETMSFTLGNFTKMGSYLKVFGRSVWLAVLSTLICLLIAYPLSLILSKSSARQQMIFVLLITLPMWMNFLLRTYAWLTLLEKNGLINRFLHLLGLPGLNIINTPGAVVLGMVYNYLPFMILPIFSVLSKIDKSYLEAAGDLGADSYHAFLRIVLPMSMPGVLSGVTMVFVPAISTFVISKMLGGGANMMLGDLIEMQFLGNAYNPNLGSAISLIMMVLILISMGVMNKVDDPESGGGGMIF